MATRITRVGVFCIALTLAGCQVIRPSAPVVLPAGVVEPLTEAEFDEFAFRLAARLSSAISRERVRTPAVLRVPTVAPGEDPPTREMRLFSRSLAEGLADRMCGRIEIAEVTGRAPDLHATVSWPDASATDRTLTVLIRDERTMRTLVNEQASIGVSAAESSSAVQRDMPAGGETIPKTPIEIRMHASEIGPHVRRRLDDYSANTVDGDQGKVIFLDRHHERFFAFESQSVTRNQSGVTLEVNLRPISKDENVVYRVLFFDANGQTLGVTPVTPRRLPANTSIKLRAMTRDARAERYVFLFERD